MTRPGRARLGKGLGALLGDDAFRPGRDDPGLRSLRRDRIQANPFQPRKEFDSEELQDLQESIRTNGLLQPLVVRPDPDEKGAFQLVAGERRLRAVTNLGWEAVPAVVREVDDQTLLVLALVENIQRAQLGPLEEAEGYRSLVDEFGLTQAEVAEAVGKSRSTVTNTLRLLRLPPSVRRLLADGELSMGHARALLSLDHPGRISELARRAAAEGWTVRKVEEKTRRPEPAAPSGNQAGRDGSPATSDAGDPVVRTLEELLQERLGTRVLLRSKDGGAGEIRIPFRSGQDFDRIFHLITGEETSDIVG
jgi:ParB family transcriptional regulator, chromosome partitioning protein